MEAVLLVLVSAVDYSTLNYCSN